MKKKNKPRIRAVSRSNILISGTVLVVLLSGIYESRGHTAANNVPDHSYIISMNDYNYSPAHMNWHVGDLVTITLVNHSGSHPAKPHEWMVGRNPNTETTAFGPALSDGFKTPFFEGVEIQLVEGTGLTMLMPGAAKLTGIDPKTVLAKDAMDMGNMDMGGMKSAEATGMSMPDNGMGNGMNGEIGTQMATGADAGKMPGQMNGKKNSEPTGDMDMKAPEAKDMSKREMPKGDMPADDTDMGGMNMGGMAMDEHDDEGFMPVMGPRGHVTISFRVPDKLGDWTFGCFQQSGQHYLNGMHGTITVTKG